MSVWTGRSEPTKRPARAISPCASGLLFRGAGFHGIYSTGPHCAHLVRVQERQSSDVPSPPGFLPLAAHPARSRSCRSPCPRPAAKKRAMPCSAFERLAGLGGFVSVCESHRSRAKPDRSSAMRLRGEMEVPPLSDGRCPRSGQALGLPAGEAELGGMWINKQRRGRV